MCAICGWQNLKEGLMNQKETFQEMLETMSCRGKDHTGYYCEDDIMLGHKRLAIVDLTSRKSTNVFWRVCDCV